jgi:SAM-dependent methyltransferase
MIEIWSRGPADENMPEAMLVETLALAHRHPWGAARARIALAVLEANGLRPPAPILDVGCGWGVTLQAFENAGYHVTGLDISRRILELVDQPRRRLIEADLNQPPPASREIFAGALLLDVIEHLDDDRATLRRIAPLVQPNGTLVVSVPALPELFSEFDRIQGHRRRYLPETLRAAFDGTGFAVQKIFWWGSWMVPILRRLRQKSTATNPSAPRTYADHLRLPPWPVPLLIKGCFAWEHHRALREKLRTGTSLFAVARREN